MEIFVLEIKHLTTQLDEVAERSKTARLQVQVAIVLLRPRFESRLGQNKYDGT